MPTFEDIARPGECDVCGKETDVVVVCSAMGPVSLAYCNDCYNRNLEPYSLMVSYIAMAGHWPDDINPTYQEIVRKNLEFYRKSEEEFADDVNKEIEMDTL